MALSITFKGKTTERNDIWGISVAPSSTDSDRWVIDLLGHNAGDGEWRITATLSRMDARGMALHILSELYGYDELRAMIGPAISDWDYLDKASSSKWIKDQLGRIENEVAAMSDEEIMKWQPAGEQGKEWRQC